MAGQPLALARGEGASLLGELALDAGDEVGRAGVGLAPARDEVGRDERVLDLRAREFEPVGDRVERGGQLARRRGAEDRRGEAMPQALSVGGFGAGEVEDVADPAQERGVDAGLAVGRQDGEPAKFSSCCSR